MSELNHPLALSGDAGIATVYDQGAHVASWTPFGHDPVLFVSRRSGFQVGRSIRGGIPVCFPWFGPGQPVMWWSPAPRMVLPVSQFKLSRSLRKTIARFRRTPGCELRIDNDFPTVIRSCADKPRALSTATGMS